MNRIAQWCLLVALLAIALPVSAQTLVATGKGRAVVGGNSVAGAREAALGAALDDALAKASAKSMGLDENDWTQDQTDLFELKILPHRKEYLDTWDILYDAQEGDAYKVTVRATFREKLLSAALVELGVKKHAKTWQRIMVVLPEQHLTRWIPDPAAETEIIRQFTEAGLQLIDQKQFEAIRYNDQTVAAAKGDNAAAAAIGRKFGAEIVVVGEAFSEDAPGYEGRPTCRARVEARMIRTDNATIIAANGMQASAFEATEEMASKKSLAKAGGDIAQYFLDQLDKRAKEAANGPTPIDLVISNIPYKQFTNLKTSMKDRVPGITEFHQRSYEANRAELEVLYTNGDAQALADALATAKFPLFRLTIVKATVNRIDMQAAPSR